MSKYLIQKGSNHVFVATEALSGRSDMRPYNGSVPPTPESIKKALNGEISEIKDVTPEALPDFFNMTKKQLEDYGKEHLGVDIDRRKTQIDLAQEISELAAKKASEKEV